MKRIEEGKVRARENVKEESKMIGREANVQKQVVLELMRNNLNYQSPGALF